MTIKTTYFVGINILSFLLAGWDKYSAIKHNFRISEKSLFGISILGGAIGLYLGMIIFHHKTKKKNFQIGIPLCILWNIYLFYII